MAYEIKIMLGALVFETSDSKRYAIATLMASNYKLRVRGGNTDNTQQLGSDIAEDDLNTREAVSVIMMALGIPHDEDVWCEILDTLQIHASKRIMVHDVRYVGIYNLVIV